MIRKSGSRPAVKRSKFAWVTLRRAASGHIAATQLPKFAAACRIAEAVIRGWPEAPSSPLQGGGGPSAPVAACAGGAVADFCPEKMLLKKFETPLPPWDWAKTLPQNSACPANTSAAATEIAAVRFVIAVPARCMSYSSPDIPFQEALSRFPMV